MKLIRTVLASALVLVFLGANLVTASPRELATGRAVPDPETMEVKSVWVAGSNVMISQAIDIKFSGDFAGVCRGEETITVHAQGTITVRGTLTCENAELFGKTGNARFLLAGTGDAATGTFELHVVAVDAGGDLENLRAQGTVTGQSGVGAEYSVWVHFDPS